MKNIEIIKDGTKFTVRVNKEYTVDDIFMVDLISAMFDMFDKNEVSFEKALGVLEGNVYHAGFGGSHQYDEDNYNTFSGENKRPRSILDTTDLREKQEFKSFRAGKIKKSPLGNSFGFIGHIVKSRESLWFSLGFYGDVQNVHHTSWYCGYLYLSYLQDNSIVDINLNLIGGNMEKSFLGINFDKCKYKGKDITLLHKRFLSRGFGIVAYEKAYDLNDSELSKLLSGRLKGCRAKPNTSLRRMILQLKKDEVWVGRLPWEKENDNTRASW